MDDKIAVLRQWIAESNNIVFLGGAGVSTESGIPDFRGENGIYQGDWKVSPETILTGDFFEREPDEFTKFLREKMAFQDVKPNKAHIRLAELEREGKLRAVITQNVDGLHQAAGSKNVLELHGTLQRAYCARCKKPFPADVVNRGDSIPRCGCGGVIRPDVVLYGEMLDEKVLRDSINAIAAADVFIVGGSSLGVYPAAGLINYYRGSKMALVNRSATPYDRYANLVIHEKIGEVFSQI